jgi:glycerol-3-phosphate dehydrogenase subunit B
MVTGPPGATVLGSGALDLAPWDEGALGPLDDTSHLVLSALDAYAVPDGGVVLTTLGGLVRPARGCDRAVLDLSPLHGTVLVPGADHAPWDAEALARTWGDSRWARERALSFVAQPVRLTRLVDEHALPHADVAARHDDPSRLAWLAERLLEAVAAMGRAPSAILLPAWLGVERARAAELTARVGVPCGETLTGLAGPAGLRFERARDRALVAARVQGVPGRATRVARSGPDLRVDLEVGEAVVADAVVLATGGLIGGGLEYTPAGAVLSAALPPATRPIARATIDAPVRLGAWQRVLETPSSLSGSPPESHAWPYAEDPLLGRVGVLADEDGCVTGGPERLYAAGDLAADRPRTWLDALGTGARAGARAATP